MISELDGLTRGSLSIGSAGHKALYKPLMEFHQRYPDIKVSIYDLKTEETIEKLLNSELDLGLVYLPVNNPRIQYIDRKSTRLNSSHVAISYAVFCLKKKRMRAAHEPRWR